MSGTMRMIMMAMAIGRVLIGMVPMAGATSMAVRLGFPAAHDNPTTRLMARFFGVRDIGLGVLIFYSLAHLETLGFMILFNAAMDAGDLLSIAIPLLRRQGIDRAAISSSIFAAGGGLAWLAVWIILR